MRIIRYQNNQGNINYAAEQGDGWALKLCGDIYAGPQLSGERCGLFVNAVSVIVKGAVFVRMATQLVEPRSVLA